MTARWLNPAILPVTVNLAGHVNFDQQTIKSQAPRTFTKHLVIPGYFATSR
jgi:hypothetical protein